MKWLDGITDLMDLSLSKLREMVKDGEAWCAAGPWGHKESGANEQLNITKIGKNTYLGVDSKEPACNAGERGSIPG